MNSAKGSLRTASLMAYLSQEVESLREGLAFLVALFLLSFTIWKHFGDEDEEKKRREAADAVDRLRCRTNDQRDVERRQRADEEDEKRRSLQIMRCFSKRRDNEAPPRSIHNDDYLQKGVFVLS